MILITRIGSSRASETCTAWARSARPVSVSSTRLRPPPRWQEGHAIREEGGGSGGGGGGGGERHAGPCAGAGGRGAAARGARRRRVWLGGLLPGAGRLVSL